MRTALLLGLVLAFAGCIGGPTAPEEPGPDAKTNDASIRAISENFTGTALGTPTTPYSQELEFTVPQGAVGINATLKWSAPVARFTLTLIDPQGETVEQGYPEQTGVLRIATLDPPRSGTWTFVVGSTASVNVPWTLEAIAELIVPQDNLVRTTARMEGTTFREVNVIMEENATFNFTFAASAPVKWDVHSHPPEGVKYWQEGQDASKSGAFTAPARGIYSLLFENDGATAIDITYEMMGAFRLHSHAQ